MKKRSKARKNPRKTSHKKVRKTHARRRSLHGSTRRVNPRRKRPPSPLSPAGQALAHRRRRKRSSSGAWSVVALVGKAKRFLTRRGKLSGLPTTARKFKTKGAAVGAARKAARGDPSLQWGAYRP